MSEKDYIILEGLRSNNLKNISLKVPKNKITIFTGVSGSGKSSIVFDTIASEAGRQQNESFSSMVRLFLPKYNQPEADRIDNLSSPVIIDQSRLGGNARSTLGTSTEVNSYLRTLFSRLGTNSRRWPIYYSFNDTTGMCSACEGIGRKLVPNMKEIIDETKSIKEGAILLKGYGPDSLSVKMLLATGFFNENKKVKDFDSDERHMLFDAVQVKTKYQDININYDGLLVKLQKNLLGKGGDSEKSKEAISKLFIEDTCDVCKGRRLHEDVYKSLIDGKNIADLCEMQLDELAAWLKNLNLPEGKILIDSALIRVNHMIDIGLGYLTLDRQTSTLSGGESQRVKMIKYLNSTLVDLMYVFDEPSIGLHPRDVHRLNELLHKLKERGNTVIVVEHDPDVIKMADWIVDVGPKAGRNGGEIVFEGTYEDLLKSNTTTGVSLSKKLSIKEDVRKPKGFLEVKDAKTHNLKNVSTNIPIGVLTVVTGVAGSGKSSLIKYDFMSTHKDAIIVDQSPIGNNSRSSLATYSGVWDEIRKIFGKANNVDAALFSSNSKGGCSKCKGAGFIEVNLSFMENFKGECDECHGTKFKKEIFEYKYKGLNVFEVLEKTIVEAIELFDEKNIRPTLEAMSKMGIGYLTLGQTLDTISGGESQRLKLALELKGKSNIIVLDEPTTGLHMADIENFMNIIDAIVSEGNTVIMIEHNVECIKRADWIIDIGPEGGTKGGEIIFEGTPTDLKKCKNSLTAQYI